MLKEHVSGILRFPSTCLDSCIRGARFYEYNAWICISLVDMMPTAYSLGRGQQGYSRFSAALSSLYIVVWSLKSVCWRTIFHLLFHDFSPKIFHSFEPWGCDTRRAFLRVVMLRQWGRRWRAPWAPWAAAAVHRAWGEALRARACHGRNSGGLSVKRRITECGHSFIVPLG